MSDKLFTSFYTLAECGIETGAYINNKNKKQYIVLGVAYDSTGEREAAAVVVYLNDSNQLFVRDVSEFLVKFTRA